MPDTPVAASPRIVPGAPPPAPLSKSQKKKRKGGAKAKEESESSSPIAVPDTTTAALIEKAPEENDVKEGVVAPQLVVQPSEGEAVTPIGDQKTSPIVEMLNKRLKANGKKITRIQNYQNDPPEKLNEDQKRLLKTLPTLEAVSKELEEVKKAIETHEAEVAQELAFVKAEAARAQEDRIREAVAATQAEYLDKTAELVTFLQLRSMLSSRLPQATALNLTEIENIAICSITETLLHPILPGKTETIRGIFTGEGEHINVPYSRIREIHNQFLYPPPPQEMPEEVPPPATPVPEETPLVGGVPPTVSTSGGIHFIMTDELAEADASAEYQPEGSEWVDVQGAPEPETAEVEITETVVEAQVNGHTVVEDTVTITTTEVTASGGQLNWADEDHEELPSLANLQAHYGTSGEVSPVPEAEIAAPESAQVNGNGNGPVVDEDGFTTPHRGRGRGRGGFRGERGGYRGERGGYRGERGGYRGSFRGEGRGENHGERGGRGGFRGEHGERGGYRGEHGERGGYRGEHGERGGYRGEHGERGGYRGEHGERGRGGWRGGERGFRGRPDGEWRGGRGGRGRGRGFPEAQQAQGVPPPAA